MLRSLHSNGDCPRKRRNGMTSTRRTEGQNLVVGGCETRRDVTFVVYFQISLSLVFITRGRRYRPPPLRLPSSRDSYSSMYMLLLLLLLVVVTLFVLFPSLHSFISDSYLALSFSCFASNGFRSSSESFCHLRPKSFMVSTGCVPFGAMDGRETSQK